MTVSHGSLGVPEGIADQVRAAVMSEDRTIADLSIVLSDHATVTRLNQLHLGRTYATDVLAFDLGDDETSGRRGLEGEIYVDLDTAFERAPEFGSSYEEEVRRYVLHGVLHLMGYRDDEPETAKEMRRLENLYLG